MATTETGTGKKTAADRIGDVIATVADKLGVPVEVALAGGYYESKLKPTATGDRGFFQGSTFVPDPSGPPHSFGIYQLFDHGEGAGLSQAAAFDVYTNAMRALPGVARAKKANPSLTWGQAFAASQRPADQAAEAAAVDSYIQGFSASHTDDPVAYFASLPGSWAGTPVKDSYGAGATPTNPGQTNIGNGNATSSAASQVNAPKADDWITALDSAMSPKLGWNPLKDTGEVLKFVTVRGGIALVGVVFVGAGLLLMFGRDIFGAAVTALVPEARVAGAASGIVNSGQKAATVAKKAATEAA